MVYRKCYLFSLSTTYNVIFDILRTYFKMLMPHHKLVYFAFLRSVSLSCEQCFDTTCVFICTVNRNRENLTVHLTIWFLLFLHSTHHSVSSLLLSLISLIDTLQTVTAQDLSWLSTSLVPLSSCVSSFFLPLLVFFSLAHTHTQKAWPLFIRGHCNNKLM